MLITWKWRVIIYWNFQHKFILWIFVELKVKARCYDPDQSLKTPLNVLNTLLNLNSGMITGLDTHTNGSDSMYVPMEWWTVYSEKSNIIINKDVANKHEQCLFSTVVSFMCIWSFSWSCCFCYLWTLKGTSHMIRPNWRKF